MNTNFENMIKELKDEFPDDWEKGLNGLEIEIIDDAESLDELAMEDGYIEFEDKIMNINYKGNIVSIESPWESGGFVTPKTFWYWEDLEKIGRILEIVSKYAKKDRLF